MVRVRKIPGWAAVTDKFLLDLYMLARPQKWAGPIKRLDGMPDIIIVKNVMYIKKGKNIGV